ncbi:Flp pilus assembly protein CpaB [Lichenicola sp.]|uniref:Flp pilus assembly protein CpaB n=1 Tax=Lichenicola sp. TaxID=2804529 RepID=UPI003B0035C4
MILRLFMFGMMAIGLAGLGVFGWRAVHPPAPPPQVAAAAPKAVPVMINIIVASRDLLPGSFLRPDDLSTAAFAATAAPPDAMRDTPAERAKLVGALIRRVIPHESVLDPAQLLLTGDHGFLAAILAPGMRAFTISQDQILSNAGLIWPGDRLDLILTQQMPTTTPPERQISAETVLTGLRVLAIDRQLVQPPPPDDKSPGNNGPAAPAAVTVEVSPVDAERLAVALRLGKVAFAVRSATPGVADSAPSPMPAQAPAPGSTTWAGAVMHSLNGLQPPPVVSVHVFEGDGDKEYKF